jgi:hypothetical protein
MPLEYLDTILEVRQVRIPYNSHRRCLLLSEKDKNSDISRVEITGFDSVCLAFRLEGLKKPYKTHLYLKKSAVDIHKGCDGVLIFRFKGIGYILVCELKSRNVSGFKKQIHSSHAFVDYLCSLVKRFGDSDMSGFKRMSVLFTTRPFANKRPFMRKPPYKGPMGDESLIEFFCDPNKRDVPSYPVKLLLPLD